jgi:hypothetical protein
MRIVGFIGDNQNTRGYLVSISNDEIHYLAANGFESGYPSGGPRTHEMRIGTDIRIGDLWRQIVGLRTGRESLASAARALRGIADAITAFDPVIDNATRKEGDAS